MCGCRGRGVHGHHVVFRQEVVRRGGSLSDVRNIVLMTVVCHMNFHARAMRLEARKLPDSVFEFARELLGPGRAFNYLRARYVGADPRLDALLQEHEAAA